MLFGLETFISLRHSSVKAYDDIRNAYLHRHHDEDMPTRYNVTRFIENTTGIVSVKHDMCPKTHIAYTGPFADLDKCPVCGEKRYLPDSTKPQQQFFTIPLGPQLQALWRQRTQAKAMRHRRDETRKIISQIRSSSARKIPMYEDIYHGYAYLKAVHDGDIGDDDMVVMMSIDGAQLYESKQSDCWIYIWVVLDLSPKDRYRQDHVLIGGIIPGPEAPGHLDSFLFPGLYHINAVNNEPNKLRIWDAFEQRSFGSSIYHFLTCADAVGMAQIDGCVGHTGRHGCRLFCPVPGRRKDNNGIYFPVLRKPDNYNIPGCTHPDVNPLHLPSGDPAEYWDCLLHLLNSSSNRIFNERRLETGVVRPNLFLAYPPTRILEVPGCFAGDIMHVCALNIPPFLLSLWRGSATCDRDDDVATWDWVVLKDHDVWKRHGKLVADAHHYLPDSFDRPPRNPAEKISSGYKAQEYLTYFYGLGPALLYQILPDKYWKNFCKLVRGVRIIHQKQISQEEIQEAHQCLVDFVTEFEELYIQRKVTRIHFARQCIHSLLHVCPEIIRVGPAACYAQWTMERTIGSLGQEIHQHSNPFMNISQRGLLRAQINALYSIYPDLKPHDNKQPSEADFDIGGGMILLHAHDEYPTTLEGVEAEILKNFLEELHGNRVSEQWSPRVIRWSRLQLSNGQIVRSRWKEIPHEITSPNWRRSRFVMVC